MDIYVMLNGVNPQKEEVLNLINVKESSIERFRDCGLDTKKSVIWILARTGSKNAFDKTNEHLEKVESYIGKKDEPFDPTYELIFFSVPAYRQISGISHYPIPNIKEVLDKGMKDLEKGKVNQRTQDFLGQLDKTLNQNVKGKHIISLLDEN